MGGVGNTSGRRGREPGVETTVFLQAALITALVMGLCPEIAHKNLLPVPSVCPCPAVPCPLLRPTSCCSLSMGMRLVSCWRCWAGRWSGKGA